MVKVKTRRGQKEHRMILGNCETQQQWQIMVQFLQSSLLILIKCGAFSP